MRLRICNDLLFYYDDRPGISPAFIVGYGFGLGVVWLWLWLWGSGVRGSVCEVAPFVVGWFFFLWFVLALLGSSFCRWCNSISVFLWHCLCVVLFYVNVFN